MRTRILILAIVILLILSSACIDLDIPDGDSRATRDQWMIDQMARQREGLPTGTAEATDAD